MTTKPFSNMSPTSIPFGNEWSSVASYLFKYQEKLMVLYYYALDQDVEMLKMYLAGMATLLMITEDNGMPTDLDEVIHAWDHDEPFDIEAALRLAQENL